MTIKQLGEPCWVPSWPGDDRDDAKATTGPHYASAAALPVFRDGTGRLAFHWNCGGTRGRQMIGRVYLERGEPVTVLARWSRAAGGERTHDDGWHRPPKKRAPRNVLIERADGSKVVRPFRGLRRVPS